jgi:hypothetical protein
MVVKICSDHDGPFLFRPTNIVVGMWLYRIATWFRLLVMSVWQTMRTEDVVWSVMHRRTRLGGLSRTHQGAVDMLDMLRRSHLLRRDPNRR